MLRRGSDPFEGAERDPVLRGPWGDSGSVSIDESMTNERSNKNPEHPRCFEPGSTLSPTPTAIRHMVYVSTFNV